MITFRGKQFSILIDFGWGYVRVGGVEGARAVSREQ
jgi:hypothetical protein